MCVVRNVALGTATDLQPDINRDIGRGATVANDATSLSYEGGSETCLSLNECGEANRTPSCRFTVATTTVTMRGLVI